MQLPTQDDELLQLVDRIYDTVESPDAWPALMDSIARWTGAPAVGIRQEYKHAGALKQSWYGLPDAFERLYVDGLWRSDPWAATADSLPVGLIVTGHDELTRISPDIPTAPFINDLLRPLGFSEVVGVIVRRDDACLFTLSALYDVAKGALEARLRSTLTVLAPHVTRAINLGHRLQERERIAAISHDIAQTGVIVVDPSLTIVSANDCAAAMIADGTTLRVSATNRLMLGNAVARERLAEVIRGERVEEAIHLTSSTGPNLVLSVRRLSGTHRLLYRILIVDPADEGRWTGRILEGAFNLTPAEARLAALVGRGASPAQAASSLGVAVSTARTQLLRVFDKLGVHRQSDLVRLIERLSSLATSP